MNLRTTNDAVNIGRVPLWLTCTPKHFVGDAAHMARDTGLLSGGFVLAGVRSNPMMPGPACPEDDPRIIRTDPPKAMWDPAYWESLEADGVVLYAWGVPQYTGIARAIRQAGLKLVVHLDSSGLFSPLVDGWDYNHLVYRRHIKECGLFIGGIKASMSIARSMLPWVMDLPRLEHMAQGHIIGTVSPVAFERIKNFALHYQRPDVAEKLRLVLHPISPHMKWNGEEKSKQMCIVGRWTKTDWVKNVWLLVDTLREALPRHPDYRVIVVGSYDETAERLFAELPDDLRRRIDLAGRLPNEKVAEIYTTSRISLCTSYSEGFHTSSAEALCVGASVVGYHSPYLPNLPYYAAENSGTIADEGTGKSMARAITEEIGRWENGKRDPAAISRIWSARLHSDKVALEIMSLCEAAG